MTTVILGSDHGALDLKNKIKEHLSKKENITVIDKGVHTEESVDYPDVAETVVNEILGSDKVGILCCGTGIGISIKANRYKGIRAALVKDDFTAQMAKEHNNANILCLGGRTTTVEQALSCVDTWLDTAYEGGRHERRVQKLDS